MGRDRVGHVVVALVDVGDEQHRLGGERAEQAERVGGVVGRRDQAGGTAGLEHFDQRPQPCLLGDGVAVATAGLAHDPLEPALGLLEVGEHQLGLDRLDVGDRIDAAVGMDDPRVLVRPHDVHDRVGLADVGQELVAEPLAAVGAGDEPGDVVELDRVRHELGGPDRRGDRVEALVVDREDRDVGLDRGERVVGRLGGNASEGAEQRGLARVGHPDDPDLHRHDPTAVPSRAPASTSLG